MRRFVFSLQKVLDYRQRLEEQAIRAFAEAQRHLENERALLAHLVGMRTRCLAGSPRARTLAVQMLEVEQNYLAVLEERIIQQRQRVAEAEQALEGRRRELIEAQRERKMMERLREKHFEQWRQEFLNTEQKALDDLATVRAVFAPGALTISGGSDDE